MSIRISFKLKGYEKQMALALQHQMSAEGHAVNLDTIVERLFVGWMNRNLLKENTNATASTSTDAESNLPEAPAPDNSHASREPEENGRAQAAGES
jgi:hypothetical protein